jgi:hypothetical protein
MTSFYKEGSKVQFEGYKGTVTIVTETYRKNVLIVKITEYPKHGRTGKRASSIGLFEYPDGRLEFMSFIE